MLRNEGEQLKLVVVCSPGPEYFNVKNRHEHNITQLADHDKARHQHDQLKSLLAEFGCEVIDLPELAGHPNSVFKRDPVVCTPRGYIKLKMGLTTRRGEEDWMSKALEGLGEPFAGMLDGGATAEGGDIILAGKVAFVGESTRTNERGKIQLKNMLQLMDYEVRSIKVPQLYLHLGGAMSMVAPNRVLCCQGVFPEDFFEDFQKIEVPVKSFVSGNVICLGENEVIADRSNEATIQILRKSNVKVHALNLSEYVKGTGGPSCLVLPVTRGS